MSDLNTLADLKDFGTNLGLEGDELANFIKEQQSIQREERAVTREIDREKIQRDREREELDKARAHEMRLLELQQTLGNSATLNESNNVGDTANFSTSKNFPNMPIFNDGDDITAYLIRFE
jgi:hypothetical protein